MVAFTWWWSSSCWWLWALRWSVYLSVFTMHTKCLTRASKVTKDSTCGTFLLVCKKILQPLSECYIIRISITIIHCIFYLNFLCCSLFFLTDFFFSCLPSSFWWPGLVVFPGSHTAPQFVRAGGQLSRRPLCAGCTGRQPGLVFLARGWQHCNTFRSLWSGCHE